MKTGTKTDAPATDKKTAPKEKAPKIEVMKSQALLDLATPLFAATAVEPSLCGLNEIKLRMSHESRNMSCYIRHTRKGLLLQLPKNKLDVIIGKDLKANRDRETQRQTVYIYPEMAGLAAAVNAACAAHSIEAPVAVAPRAKKDPAAKKDAPVKAGNDAPVEAPADGKSVREAAAVAVVK